VAKVLCCIMITLSALLYSTLSFGQIVAQCSDPKGFGYYPYMGLIPEKSENGLHAGWNEDGISRGLFQLNKVDETNFDILFVDATKQIISSVADGGVVIKNSSSENSASFVVIYPRKTIEIYTFIKDKNGTYEYTHVTSRSGDEVPIIKTSLMRGDCTFIDFAKLQ
jgi:hypothetical protein